MRGRSAVNGNGAKAASHKEPTAALHTTAAQQRHGETSTFAPFLDFQERYGGHLEYPSNQ